MIKNRLLRIALPIVFILVWLGLGSVGGPTFGKISDVTTNDRATFLPSSAESTKVQELQSKYQQGQSIPAIVILESAQPLDPAAIGSYRQLAARLSQVDGVEGPVIGPIPSQDRKAVEFIATVSTRSELKTVVGSLREQAREFMQKSAPQAASNASNISTYVTGPAGLSADLAKAFGGIDGILLAVALSAVFVILLAVYRSLLLPVLVLVNAVFALCAAIFVVYLLAKHNVIELNGQSQGILSILVIGAATDYSLLLVARYKEAFETLGDTWQAITAGVKGAFEPILASAATVVLALLCLLFSDLNSNKSLGPIAAAGIVFSFLATLTFLPSILAIFGKTAFWPTKLAVRKPARGAAKTATVNTGLEDLAGIWRRAGRLIAARPRITWVTLVVLLLASSLGLLQLKADGVAQTDIVLSQSNAADGQKAIARHYSPGSGAPILVAVPQSSAQTVLDMLRGNEHLTDVMLYGGRGPTASTIKDAKALDGKLLISATLTTDPYSDQAETVVRGLRDELSRQAPGSLVGGTTALDLDTSATSSSDFKKIVPLVLVMICIVLAFLLRAAVAPLILIFTVVLSFAATLGISALVFNHIFGFPGADATVPLFGFVFLVALGVDYNIFLVSRTREEARTYDTKPAILHSLGKTGGVITSAGIVLAATFAALGIIPILFLAQIAFIVAFGVLLDTFIVRSLLVPALLTDIGSKVWWPSKLK